jgi:hypothetical protein
MPRRRARKSIFARQKLEPLPTADGVRHLLWRWLRHFGVACGAFFLLIGIVGLVQGFVLAPKIDANHRCHPQETGRCFSSQSGLVRSSDSYGAQVGVDDNRRVLGIDLVRGAYPRAGSRVDVESWNGDIVSLYDHASERRYHTIYWPRRWDPYSLFFIGIAVALIVGCLGRPRRALLRRLRRQTS